MALERFINRLHRVEEGVHNLSEQIILSYPPCIILTVSYVYSLMPPAAVVMRLMVELVSTSSVRVSWESINNPMIINYTIF